MGKIDLSCLPRTSRGIDWKSSVGYSIPFVYRGISDELVIASYISKDDICIRYKEKDYIIKTQSLLKCCLGSIFNFGIANNYQYHVGDVVQRKTSIRVKQQIRLGSTKTVKGYVMQCQTCNQEFTVREHNLNKGDGCPYCSNHKVLVGFNDVWTTRPDVARYFTDPQDGYLYTKNSNAKVNCVCPFCKSDMGMRKIIDLTTSHASCPRCSDGISYPNKLMLNLLQSLNIDFETEVQFDWCVFPSFLDTHTFTTGRYDFVLNKKKVIVEMDSGLGHGNIIFGAKQDSIKVEESIYKDKMKTELAEKYGYKIIRVNCPYYSHQNKFLICKNAILSSELSNMFDLSEIDWEAIDCKCQKSILIDVCNLYCAGLSSGEISHICHLSLSTVIDYLHKGTELQLCNFVPYQNIRRK